jgi:Peptidase family M28
MGAVLRAWALGLFAVGIWLLSGYIGTPHHTVDASAPATAFSSARADATLARVLGPEIPHQVSSAENAAVRARILKEFASLGVPTHTYQAFTCNPWRGLSFVACATVTDIIAEVIPGQGKAIVMMAHYDSVPAGPGASDDESGVATVLETTRALKAAGSKSIHPVIALITDGEEAGLLGANAFLQNAALKARVGVVVNVEARGTKGPSLLFQTSPGDGKLIDLYAAHVPVYGTSSLYAEIYKFLPNDTDLTLFIHDGFPSFNFAFADNVRYYHSPFDLRRNLNKATLQMHGENLLGVVTGLEQTDYAALKGGNDVYLSVLGKFLPRVPASWALPLAIIVFILLAIAAWLARGEPAGWRSTLAAAAMPLALLLGCGLMGWLVSFIAQTISGAPDPSYAYPLALRVALTFAVWAIALDVSRMTNAHGAAASAWLWIAGFGIVTAALLPGISPYFVFPGAIAAVLLLATARAPGGWNGLAGQIALLVSAIAALLIWIALVASGETLMGLRLHPLFTIPAAFGLLTIVPLLSARPMSRAAWGASAAAAFVLSLGFAVAAGLQPPYKQASPQRIDLVYFENAKGDARWIADTSWKGLGAEPIPAGLIKAGNLKLTKDALAGLYPHAAYAAPAGTLHFPLPTSTVVNDTTKGTGRVVTLNLKGSDDTDEILLRIPQDAKLQAVDFRGQHVVPPAGWSGDTEFACVSRDCRDETITLTFAGDASGLTFAEGRYAFPPFGAFLKAARPKTAMASQSGDQIILTNTVKMK